MKKSNFWFIAVFFSILFTSVVRMPAQNVPLCSDALEQALSLAGTNRKSLEIALKACEGDTLRYHAMCYLIENMPYHHTIENCRKKAEYDENCQSAPERRAYVSLTLNEPQWVECVRIKAKNAENHVVAKHWYVLRRWTSEGWEIVWQGQALNHLLPPLSLVVNGMYWLSDLTKGKEDLPFLVGKEGKISFPYEWLMPK